MTASTVHPPPHPNGDVELRRVGDGDWPQLVDLTMAGEEDDAHVTRDFIQRKTDSWEHLVRAGHGHWWGAFIDDAWWQGSGSSAPARASPASSR